MPASAWTTSPNAREASCEQQATRRNCEPREWPTKVANSVPKTSVLVTVPKGSALSRLRVGRGRLVWRVPAWTPLRGQAVTRQTNLPRPTRSLDSAEPLGTVTKTDVFGTLFATLVGHSLGSQFLLVTCCSQEASRLSPHSLEGAAQSVLLPAHQSL